MDTISTEQQSPFKRRFYFQELPPDIQMAVLEGVKFRLSRESWPKYLGLLDRDDLLDEEADDLINRSNIKRTVTYWLAFAERGEKRRAAVAIDSRRSTSRKKNVRCACLARSYDQALVPDGPAGYYFSSEEAGDVKGELEERYPHTCSPSMCSSFSHSGPTTPVRNR